MPGGDRPWSACARLALSCVALAACGDDATAVPDAGVTRDAAPPDGSAPDAGPPPPVMETPYEPAPPLTPFDDPAIARLRGAIDAQLDSLGGVPLTALVRADGEVLYERNPDMALIPASNTKLFTTAAAYDLLGEDYTFDVSAHAAAAPSGGMIAGELFVVAHCFLAVAPEFYADLAAPFDDLARRLAAAGVTRVSGRVVLAGEISYDGSSVGTYDAGRERSQALAPLVSALGRAGISVSDSATSAATEAPAGSVELARTSSHPLPIVAWRINDVSHNEMADALARYLGVAMGGAPDSGPGRIAEWYGAEVGDATGLAFSDGSGLSYENRVSARHVVTLLDWMRDAHPSWERTFTIAGLAPGTLGSRLGGDDTRGRFYGKTGTLNVSIALSGVLFHRYDGRRYSIALIANGLTSSRQSEVRGVFDRTVAAVAANWREVGPRPARPVLDSVGVEGELATIRFTADPGAEGHLVWLSSDPYLFDRAEARYVSASPVDVRVEPGVTTYVRVTSFASGLDSDATDVYPVRRGSATRVLLVDGNDRWEAQPSPENERVFGHELLSTYAEALDATLLSADNDAIARGDVSLAGHDLVVWSLGEESEAHESFSRAEQALVAAHLEAGGALFVSGSEIAWDLAENGDAGDRAFFDAWLGATYASDDGGGQLADGVGPFAALDRFGILNPRSMNAEYPDVLTTMPGATELVRYPGAGTAAVANGRVVYLGFPFESVSRASTRRALMESALELMSVAR
jgi:D-alanyl-D-alanine carboxypeptidase